MHTLLLRPPPRHSGTRALLVPPLGLAYLAAHLMKNGRSVTLLDAWAEGMSWAQTEDYVAHLRPDIIGLSAMTPVADVAYRAAQSLRQYTDHIVLGGPHPTALEGEVFEHCAHIDSLIIGEGELTLLKWLDSLNSGNLERPVPGVITRNWHGGPGEAPDLNTLATPARHLLPNHKYRYPLATRSPLTTMITSRGCPFKCSFCDQSVTGRRFKARSPQSVVDEFQELERQGFQYVCLYDDVFTLDRRRVLAICDEMRHRAVKIHWKCEARVDCVDEVMLAEMAAAGCKTIAFGLETANQVGLDALQKDTTVAQARHAFTIAKRHGIETLAYVLFGIPGETPEDAQTTLQFCEDVGTSFIQFATLAPTPGTDLAAQAQAEGWATADVRGPFDDDLDRPAVLPPGWTEADLRRLMSQAMRKTYLRPQFLARQTWRMMKSGQFAYQLSDGARHAAHSLRAAFNR